MIGRTTDTLGAGRHRQIDIELNALGRRLYHANRFLGPRIKIIVAKGTGRPLTMSVTAPR
jgi:hypothetical protein